MPVPTWKIQRLGEYHGLWQLCVRCRCCEHVREIPAVFFINIYGRYKRLAEVEQWLYCSPCKGKRCGCKGKNYETAVRIPR